MFCQPTIARAKATLKNVMTVCFSCLCFENLWVDLHLLWSNSCFESKLVVILCYSIPHTSFPPQPVRQLQPLIGADDPLLLQRPAGAVEHLLLSLAAALSLSTARYVVTTLRCASLRCVLHPPTRAVFHSWSFTNGEKVAPTQMYMKKWVSRRTIYGRPGNLDMVQLYVWNRSFHRDKIRGQ
jgi:hypothetical protein